MVGNHFINNNENLAQTMMQVQMKDRFVKTDQTMIEMQTEHKSAKNTSMSQFVL